MNIEEVKESEINEDGVKVVQETSRSQNGKSYPMLQKHLSINLEIIDKVLNEMQQMDQYHISQRFNLMKLKHTRAQFISMQYYCRLYDLWHVSGLPDLRKLISDMGWDLFGRNYHNMDVYHTYNTLSSDARDVLIVSSEFWIELADQIVDLEYV